MDKEKDYFLDNLSMMVASGTDVPSALRSIQAEVRSSGLQKTISRIREEVEGGEKLWRAFKNARLLPSSVIALIRLGEESGKLADNLKLIVLQQAKLRQYKSKVTTAISYPAFVFFITIVSGLGIAWFILPRLANVFSQLRIKLPLTTQILIQVGQFLGSWGWLAVPVFVSLFLLIIYLVFFYKKTKFLGQALLLSLPALRRLITESELSRAGFTLGTLLKSGLSVPDSLALLISGSEIYVFRNFYAKLKRNIEEGNSFQNSFSQNKDVNQLISLPVQQIIISAERSGNLPEAFLSIGQTYEAKTENTTQNLIVFLEPVLLIIVWLGVLFVAFAVILPIYSLIGELNR